MKALHRPYGRKFASCTRASGSRAQLNLACTRQSPIVYGRMFIKIKFRFWRELRLSNIQSSMFQLKLNCWNPIELNSNSNSELGAVFAKNRIGIRSEINFYDHSGNWGSTFRIRRRFHSKILSECVAWTVNTSLCMCECVVCSHFMHGRKHVKFKTKQMNYSMPFYLDLLAITLTFLFRSTQFPCTN